MNKSKSDHERTVLLAEDDSTVRNFIVSLLTTAGFHVLIAEDGLDALEKATRRQD